MKTNHHQFFKAFISAEIAAICVFSFFYVFIITPQSSQIEDDDRYNDRSDLAATWQFLDGEKQTLLEKFAFTPFISIDKRWQHGPEDLRWMNWPGIISVLSWFILAIWHFNTLNKQKKWWHPAHLILLIVQTAAITGWLAYAKGFETASNTMPW